MDLASGQATLAGIDFGHEQTEGVLFRHHRTGTPQIISGGLTAGTQLVGCFQLVHYGRIHPAVEESQRRIGQNLLLHLAAQLTVLRQERQSERKASGRKSIRTAAGAVRQVQHSGRTVFS